MSGDINPAHVDPEYAKSSMFHEVIAHGMWGGALISTVLGTQLPGPGTIYIDQTLHFSRPVTLGDTITVTRDGERQIRRTSSRDLRLPVRQPGRPTVIRGTAEVLAPTEKVRRPRIADARGARDRQDLAIPPPARDGARNPTPIAMAVVHPCDRDSLHGAVTAAEADLIMPDADRPEGENPRRRAKRKKSTSRATRSSTCRTATRRRNFGVALAREGTVAALMKGSLHTDELMAEVVARRTRACAPRGASATFTSWTCRPIRSVLFITDAAINIDPTLEDKVDIVQNAIDLAQVLHVRRAQSRDAVGGGDGDAPSMRSTLDAAALCKMADRGQITGGVLDGPLAFDNAVSIVAAKTKGIRSAVAGNADILVVPDLEAGNMLAKQLEYLADAQAAGIVLGARVPIVLTSRADTVQTRLASCAVALLLAHHHGPAA